MTTLVAKTLGVQLGHKHILSDVSFTAHPGAITVIIGPNGSGKSTLLRALSGEIPFSGSAHLGDTSIAGATPEIMAQKRAVLPQSTPLSFPFQVIEIVRLGLRFRGEGSEAAARDALARVGLRGYEQRFYQDLSGGEQQRAQLARVLCQLWSPTPNTTPRWMFLDEPVSSLDIAHQLDVMQIARRFADEGGGVLAVMHDLNLSAMIADQILVLHEGRIAAAGSVKQTLTDAVLSHVYGCPIQSCRNPAPEQWFFLPQNAGRKAIRENAT